MAKSNWNQETKITLSEKCSSISSDMALLSKQITKGSKSQEVLNLRRLI